MRNPGLIAVTAYPPRAKRETHRYCRRRRRKFIYRTYIGDTARFAIAKKGADCKANDPENSRREKWSYRSIKNTESSKHVYTGNTDEKYFWGTRFNTNMHFSLRVFGFILLLKLHEDQFLYYFNHYLILFHAIACDVTEILFRVLFFNLEK